MIQYLTDSFGSEIVLITNEDGFSISMLKSTWEELQAQKELGETL